MFIGYQNDKIAFIADTREELENMPCVTLDRIEETDKEYFLHNGEYVCEIPVETMQAEVRAVRNSYLEKYVDPKQLVMVWDSLSEDDKKLYTNYRTYLLDYTDNEDWYLSNPMTLDEWKQSVEEIKANNPYPAEPIEEIEELPVVEEAVVSNLENTIEEID